MSFFKKISCFRKGKDQELLDSECLLIDETKEINENNDMSTKQMDSIDIKLKDCSSFEDDQDDLTKKMKDCVQANKDLEKQVKDARKKLAAKTATEKKYELEKEKIEILLQSNRALEQELESLNSKLNDSGTLEDYERVKNQKQVLKKQNALLQNQIEEAKQKLDKQNQLQEKRGKSEEKLQILRSNNRMLEEQFEELNYKVGLGDKVWNDFSALKKEIKTLSSYRDALENKIDALRSQYAANKYWIDNYHQLEQHRKELVVGNAKLQAIYEKTGNKLTEKRVLKQNGSEIQSTVPAVKDNNLISCLKTQDVRKTQQGLKNIQSDHEASKMQSDALQEMSAKAKTVMDKLGNAAKKFVSQQIQDFLEMEGDVRCQAESIQPAPDKLSSVGGPDNGPKGPGAMCDGWWPRAGTLAI